MQMRNPKEVAKTEYNEFYKKTFNEFLDPLQWVPGANIVTWNAVAAGNLKAGNDGEVMRLVS